MPQSVSLDGNRKDWLEKRPPGNPRVGHGTGGTDKPVVARLFYRPETEGQSVDSRFGKFKV